MNGASSLNFEWTSWTLAFSVLIVLITACFCFVSWRRSGYRRAIGLLELLRITVVVMAAILFNQPEIIEEFRPEEKPSIAVLWDNSPSMATRDVLNSVKPQLTESQSTEPQSTESQSTESQSTESQSNQPKTKRPTISLSSRREALEPLLDSSTWQDLQERFNVVIQPFSTADTDGVSDLHAPLAAAPEKIKNLLGVVMASDGDWNAGEPPVQAATQLRLKGSKGVPVFTVPIGSSSRLPDVELLTLDAPTFGIAGKSVRIPFTIESSLPREHLATIVLKTSDGEELTKEIRVAEMGRTTDAIVWKPQTTGDYTLTLTVPQHGDETIRDNNELSAPISIREEKLRVLVIESYPRWEYRYLRNALSRDPGVEVSCLLFHPGLSKKGGGNKDYIKQFPDGLDELSPYDVVFLGDVGVDEGQLTIEQCRLLKGLVEHQASGIVFMPGWQGRQFSLLDTELGDLYPVVMDEAQLGGWGARTPNHFELTELGRRSLLTKLADTRDDNIEVWESLPGFQWYAPVLKAKAGSDVLCVHKTMTNEYGRMPLLATRTFGAGKVLFMGTDGAWRWRKGVEDKYHYRFWGQVVRWMAYQRNMAKGETMRLFYSPDQPRLGQTLALNANVMESSGEPLSKGDVSARIVAPSGKAETIRFKTSGDEWGAFTGQFTSDEPGKHEVTLTCKQTSAVLKASFFVQGDAAERVGKPARPEVLEEISRVSRGKVIKLSNLAEVIQSLSVLPDPPPTVRRVQLWSHPVVAGVVIFLLGVFWVARKVVGLI